MENEFLKRGLGWGNNAQKDSKDSINGETMG